MNIISKGGRSELVMNALMRCCVSFLFMVLTGTHKSGLSRV